MKPFRLPRWRFMNCCGHSVGHADRAWVVRKHNPGIKAFGGITLNGPSGGVNPEAVQWMWRMQGGYGRVVWLPTFDADNHVKHFKDAPEGIKVVGPDGKALPTVREVGKICAQQKLVLCTDLGQTGNPSQPDGYQMLVAGLLAEGITREQIKTMGREVPGKLLMG